MATVRELVTKLGFQVNDQGLKKFESNLDNLKNTFKTIAIGATAASAALFGIAKSTASYGANIDDVSKAVGLSTKTLQEFRYVAQLSGSSAEDFDVSMKYFARTIGQAATNTQGATNSFGELGIKLKDNRGRLKSNDELLLEVSKKLSKIESPAKRAAIAQELFGRSGINVAVALSQSSKEIDKLRDEASKLGIVMSDDAIASAASFDDQLDKLKISFIGVKNIIGGALIPAIAPLIQKFLDFIVANKEIIALNLEQTFQYLTTAVQILYNVFSALFQIIKNVTDALGGSEKVLKFVLSAMTLFQALTIGKTLISAAIGFTQMAKGASLLAFALGPLPTIIILIGSLILAQGDNFEKFLGIVKNVFGVASEIISNFVNFISKSLDSISNFFGAIRNFFSSSNQFAASGINADFSRPPSEILNSANGNSTKNIDVKSNITVNLPPGTSEQQASFLKNSARDSFETQYNSNLRSVLYENPGTY